MLLLLYHHLFYNTERIDKFVSLFTISNIPIEILLAQLLKVCVAIFLVLSGYGIYKSYNSYHIKLCENRSSAFKFNLSYIKNRLIKVLSDYWIIYLIFVPIGLLFGHSFIDVYEKNVLYGLIDFFGLANLFQSPTMNATWWYMSVIIVFYIFTPLIYKLINYSPLIAFVFALMFSLIDRVEFSKWLVAFVFGMCLAKYNAFETIDSILNSKIKKAIFVLALMLLSSVLRFKMMRSIGEVYVLKFDFLFAFSIILFSYFFISRIKYINDIFNKIGELSGKIFMFHTFIYSYYFEDFIYSFKYPILIFLVLLIISVIVALLIEYISKIIRYDRLIKKLTKTQSR